MCVQVLFVDLYHGIIPHIAVIYYFMPVIVRKIGKRIRSLFRIIELVVAFHEPIIDFTGHAQHVVTQKLLNIKNFIFLFDVKEAKVKVMKIIIEESILNRYFKLAPRWTMQKPYLTETTYHIISYQIVENYLHISTCNQEIKNVDLYEYFLNILFSIPQ